MKINVTYIFRSESNLSESWADGDTRWFVAAFVHLVDAFVSHEHKLNDEEKKKKKLYRKKRRQKNIQVDLK